jgi:hypothetical protein
METTANGRYLYSLVEIGTANVVDKLYDVEYDPSDLRWHNDEPTATPEQWDVINTGANKSAFPTASNMETQYWYSPQEYGGSLMFQFQDPYYVAPPVVEPLESQKRLVSTAGQREGSYDYYYMETTTPGGRFIYSLVDIGTYDVVDKIYDVEYDPSDGKWHNDEHTASPEEWAVDNTGTKSAFPTASNMEAQYWYSPADYGGSLMFQFQDPFYVVQPPEANKRIAPTGGNLYGTYDYLYSSTTPSGNYIYSLVNKDTENKVSGEDFDISYNPVDKTFDDVGNNIPFKYSSDDLIVTPFPTAENMEIHRFYDEDVLVFKFDNPYYVAPPVPEPDESQKRLVATGGNWNGMFDYLYFENTPDGRYLYNLVHKDTTDTINGYELEYDPIEKKWYDNGTGAPSSWGVDDTSTNLSDFPTIANPETHYWYNSSGSLKFQFDDPYYVAPPVAEPVERLVSTGGDWGDNYEYLYFETTSEGRYLYGLVDIGTINRKGEGKDVEYNPSDGKFYDGGTGNPYKWGIDANGNGTLPFPTNPNMQTHYWYNEAGDKVKFQFDNPYYVDQ